MTPDDLDDIRTRAAHINESGGFPGLPAEVERLIRTDVPVMAAEVERLRTEVERLEGARAAADYYRGMHGALRAEIDRLTAERDEARYDARLMERHANAATRAYQRIAASDDPAGDARPALDALLDHLAEHMDDETDPPERELDRCRAQAAAVRALHWRDQVPSGREVCSRCFADGAPVTWPCPTIRALTSEEE